MKMKYIVIFCFFLLSSILISAQNVCGKLIDEKNQPLMFANIVLLSLPDSTFISGAISNENGEFTLIKNEKAQLLRISSVGYETIYKSLNCDNIGIVKMISGTQQLNELVIKGDLPKTRLKGDAMVTTVNGTILEKAGTAENLLDKIPNVTAQDGEICVFGRGTPEIYIDGRKVRNTSELDQLSSENIKLIEVVNNPGARYATSVKAVIRIITKKVLGEGLGFNNRMVTRNRRTYGESNFNQINFNYRKNKFDFSGMFYGGMFRSGNNQRITMETHLDKVWKQNIDATYAKTKYKNLITNFSMNFQFNDKHVMGARHEYKRYIPQSDKWHYLTKVYCNEQFYENSESWMLLNNPSTQHDLSYYYCGIFDDWNIDFNADVLWNQTESKQQTNELVNLSEERQINTLNKNKGKLYATKLIISKSLNQGTLTFGGEYSYTIRKNFYHNVENILNDDDSQIKEGSFSSFVDYTRSLGKLNLQIGFRYEHVYFDYYDNDMYIDAQSREFNHIFPSLNVNFPIRKIRMQISCTGDITRPSYNMLQNNTYYANRYTYQTGNPFLAPTLTQNLSLSASYRWINFSVGYSRVKDDIIQIAENYSNESPTISLLKYINMASYDRMSASITLSPKFGLWKPQFITQFSKQWTSIESNSNTLSLNTPITTFVWRNNFSLPANILLDINTIYRIGGHEQNMYISKDICNFSINLYKSFYKDRLSIQLEANNLFETSDFEGKVYSGIRTMDVYIADFRKITMTFRYKFNTTKDRYKGTGAGQSQKKRM